MIINQLIVTYWDEPSSPSSAIRLTLSCALLSQLLVPKWALEIKTYKVPLESRSPLTVWRTMEFMMKQNGRNLHPCMILKSSSIHFFFWRKSSSIHVLYDLAVITHVGFLYW